MIVKRLDGTTTVYPEGDCYPARQECKTPQWRPAKALDSNAVKVGSCVAEDNSGAVWYEPDRQWYVLKLAYPLCDFSTDSADPTPMDQLFLTKEAALRELKASCGFF